MFKCSEENIETYLYIDHIYEKEETNRLLSEYLFFSNLLDIHSLDGLNNIFTLVLVWESQEPGHQEK